MAFSNRNRPEVVAVGADAAHARREMDHEVGPRVDEHATDGGAIDQIVLGRARHDHGRAVTLEALDDERAEKACAARDDDALSVPEGAHEPRNLSGSAWSR